MDAAVLIQRPGEGIIYANEAAAAQFGRADAESVRTAAPEEIAQSWESYDSEGSPLTSDRYPSRRILNGTELHPEPLVTRGIELATGREAWVRVKATPVLNDDGSVAMAVSVSEDITTIKRAELFQMLLARAGEVLSSSLDYERTLQELASLAVPALADWCAVSLPEPDGMIREAALAHRDPSKVEFALEYHRRYPRHQSEEGGTAEILRGGEATLVDVTDELLAATITDPEQLAMVREVGIRSVVQVPISPPGGSPLGVLTLVNAESNRVFGREELALAEELGRRAGIAIQNAQLYAEQAHTAAVLQRSLMPRALPVIDGFALAATYRPAGEHVWVGGDFYDAFETDTGWMAFVGDISGQGVEAAAFTSEARNMLRAIATYTRDLGQALDHLNRLMFAEDELSVFTVCGVQFSGTTARIHCAGHPLPVLVRGGEARQVGAPGRIIGAVQESSISSTELGLEPGDVLVLYTDGLLDARGELERFGIERLEAALAEATSAREAVELAEAELDRFQAGPQADDTAILAIEVL